MQVLQQTFCFVTLLSIASACGCISKDHSRKEFQPFVVEELDACLAIVIDVSGSFSDDWQKNGRAHQLFMNLMDQFFTESTGLNTRVVLGQISANDDFLLFEGTPQELANRFPSPDVLNQYLREHSDPNGSKVYDATKKMIDHLVEIPEVTERTRMLTVVLSDLKDSEKDKSLWRKSGNAMLDSLKKYSKAGGGVALYFVADDEKPRWRKILKQAEFALGTYVLEGRLSETPQLPKLDQF